MKNMLCEDIDKKIAEARNAALEEAARVCEAVADCYLHCGEGPKAEASLRCARLIRALKEADDA